MKSFINVQESVIASSFYGLFIIVIIDNTKIALWDKGILLFVSKALYCDASWRG